MRDIEFGSGMKKIMKNLDALLSISETLTPEVRDGMDKLGKIDWDNAALMTGAHNQMIRNMKSIDEVSTGMYSIKKVLESQNQIQYVSDMRDSIGLVAGQIEHIKKVGEDINYIRAVRLLEPMIKEVLELTVKMDAVLDMEPQMNHIEMKLDLVHDKLDSVAKLNAESTKSAECAANMLNEIKIREKAMNEKLIRMEAIEERMENFSVSVDHVGSDTTSSSIYNKNESILTIRIPTGKEGPKGDSIRGERGATGKVGIPGSATKEGKEGKQGKDGSSFSPSFFGKISRRGRYGNMPQGTSYLSLDEIPTMIYFKKSDTSDDWTEGQAFGVSNGGYIDSDEGIRIISGLDIDRLTKHIINELKNQGAING